MTTGDKDAVPVAEKSGDIKPEQPKATEGTTAEHEPKNQVEFKTTGNKEPI